MQSSDAARSVDPDCMSVPLVETSKANYTNSAKKNLQLSM